MKIAINGETFETDQIYKIGKVEGNNIFSRDKEASRVGLTHSGFEFTIYFLDKFELKLVIFGNHLFEDVWWINPNKYEQVYSPVHPKYVERLKIMYDKLQDFRNKIEAVWSNNQSLIPHFNLFEDDKKMD